MEAAAEAEAERARRVDALQSGEEPEPEPEPQNELPHGGVSGAIIETLDGGHGTSLRAARAFAAGERRQRPINSAKLRVAVPPGLDYFLNHIL